MATVIPNLSTIRGMTKGERRLGQRLETLKRITPRETEIHTPQGLKTISNPLESEVAHEDSEKIALKVGYGRIESNIGLNRYYRQEI